MPASHKSYALHLIPKRGKWELHVAGHPLPFRTYESLSIARDDALRLVRVNACNLFVHNESGGIVKKY